MVVLDEVTDMFSKAKNSTLSRRRLAANTRAKTPITSVGIKSSSTTAMSPLLTPSVVNWDKTALEILLSQPPPSFVSSSAGKGKNSSDVGNRVDSFKIDDDLMFVPNNCVDDYYVVL